MAACVQWSSGDAARATQQLKLGSLVVAKVEGNK